MDQHIKGQETLIGQIKDTETPLNIQEILSEADKLTAGSKSQSTGLFIVRTANECQESAKNTPIPESLFKEFWFQSELCILFADTGCGKSILAVMIGEEIAKSMLQLVLYFDFELSEKQFEGRYSRDFTGHYIFDNNFLRVEINPDADLPEDMPFEILLYSSIEATIKKTGAKILIIDNITYLKDETEKSKNALPLMKQLKALKTKYGLSILCLAHTPKRDLSKPITRNDLAGSKMLINFCDSAFTIGESQQDPSVRYLKQIKVRHMEFKYDSENVCVYQITKPDNFLGFEFMCYGREREHLKQQSEQDRDMKIEKSKELSSQGFSQRNIARELGISVGLVNKFLRI